MKAKKYRLETVLGIRERAKEDASRVVALRLQQLSQAEAELKRRQLELQKCYERQNQAQQALRQELEKGTEAQKVVAHHTFLNDLKAQEAQLQTAVDKQIQVVAKAEKELEKARELLIEAARELKSIETHKANWQDAEKKIEVKREQKISDEIGSILHGRRKKLD